MADQGNGQTGQGEEVLDLHSHQRPFDQKQLTTQSQTAVDQEHAKSSQRDHVASGSASLAHDRPLARTTSDMDSYEGPATLEWWALSPRRHWGPVASGRPCANRCRVGGAVPRSVLAPTARAGLFGP